MVFFFAAAQSGSTLILVPAFLRFATLGIEYHHIHHNTPSVPCYKLAQCHEEARPGLWEGITVVDAKIAFEACFNVMYDEKTKRYEPFS